MEAIVCSHSNRTTYFFSKKGIAAFIPLIHKVRTIVDRSAEILEENYEHAQNGIT